MNDWIKTYQKTWQKQEARGLSAQLNKLQSRIDSDRKKDILSTLWMSLGLIAGLGVMYWVGATLPDSEWQSWLLLTIMAVLLVVTIIVRVRSNILRPKATDTGLYYLRQMRKSYKYRLNILTKWFWVYMVLLPVCLMLFMYQVYPVLTATWISLGILGYVGVVLYLSRKKYQRNVEETREILAELDSMISDWNRGQGD